MSSLALLAALSVARALAILLVIISAPLVASNTARFDRLPCAPLSAFCCFERGALFNRMARAFSLALFNARGVGRELAAIFLALRGSCTTAARYICAADTVFKVSILSAARHLARLSGTSAV